MASLCFVDSASVLMKDENVPSGHLATWGTPLQSCEPSRRCLPEVGCTLQASRLSQHPVLGLLSWSMLALTCMYMLSRVRLFVSPWTAACQAPLSMGFLRQEYWSGLSLCVLGALPHPGVKPTSPMPPALAGDS